MVANKIINFGFTLIELLVVLLIASILITIAVPSYRTFVLKSHRTEAMTTLTEDQAILERCYAGTFSYAATCSALPTFPQTTSNGYYQITLTNRTATTYTLTALPLGTQTKDTNCASFTLDQTNQKTAVTNGGANSTAECWRD